MLLRPTFFLLALWPVAVLVAQQPEQPAPQTDSSSRSTSTTDLGRKADASAAGRGAAHPAPEAMPAIRGTAAESSAPTHTIVASSSEIIGSLANANLYTNPALGLTLELTGEWQFMDTETRRMAEGRGAEDDPAAKEREAQQRSQCTGPLCGEPEINVALFTELNPTIGASSLFVAGFRLAPQYLDRERYPLKWFAEIMLPHSAKEVGMQPADSLTDIKLGGRPAFRLLVRQPGDEQSKEVGYVVESNGYVVLLVASTAEAADLAKLQQQIEAVKFK